MFCFVPAVGDGGGREEEEGTLVVRRTITSDLKSAAAPADPCRSRYLAMAEYFAKYENNIVRRTVDSHTQFYVLWSK